MKPPIKTQDEADRVFSYLVTSVMGVHNTTHEQAEKRVNGLYQSGILANGDPDSLIMQIQIDSFLAKEI